VYQILASGLTKPTRFTLKMGACPIETMINTVWQMADPIAQGQDCYIYDVLYGKEGPDNCLRILADGEGVAITLAQIEKISRALSAALDKNDPIKGTYILEVSSPGATRKITTDDHLRRNTGKEVNVKLKKALNNQKRFFGTLCGFDQNSIQIKIGDETIPLVRDDIQSIRLEFK